MDDGKGEKDELYHGLEGRFISLQQEHEKAKGEKESLQKRLTELTETSTQDKTVIVELRAVSESWEEKSDIRVFRRMHHRHHQSCS